MSNPPPTPLATLETTAEPWRITGAEAVSLFAVGLLAIGVVMQTAMVLLLLARPTSITVKVDPAAIGDCVERILDERGVLPPPSPPELGVDLPTGPNA